jgi:hypothetical protein
MPGRFASARSPPLTWAPPSPPSSATGSETRTLRRRRLTRPSPAKRVVFRRGAFWHPVFFQPLSEEWSGPVRLRNSIALVVAGAVFLLGMGTAVAAPAYADGPAWAISSASSPTNFAPEDKTGDDTYVIKVVDTGTGSAIGGAQIEVADTLPAGLTAASISGEDLGNGQAMSCTLTPTLGCTYEGYEVAPGDVIQVTVAVDVESGAVSPAVNSVRVSGGGAAAAATSIYSTTISSTVAGFGISGFATTSSDTQADAGVNLTAGFTLNQVVEHGETRPAADPKDVELDLPRGFVMDPTAVPQCTESEAENDTCPADAAVGVAFMSMSSGVGGAPTSHSSPVYNLVPSLGEPGALVAMLPSGLVRLGLEIRTDGDYGLRLTASNLTEVTPLISMSLTLRGITNGGACESSAPTATLSVDSWPEPAVFYETSSTLPAMTGCNRLAFDPALSIAPDSSEANEPSGYALDLRVPQREGIGGLATAELKEAAVTLPAGAGISLSAGNGLQACTEAQVGLGSSSAVMCPDASKVGDVMVKMPLLVNPLQGAVYLAAQKENLFGSLLAIYVVADDPVAGVLIKLAGRIETNPGTGQLTIVLLELPQLPVSDLELHFFGGPRALLMTPPRCGLATTTSELTPWSGDVPVSASSSFEVNSGANGTPCSDPLPFSPAFQVGSMANGAGAYDSLTLLVTRAEQEEELSRITVQTPQAVAEMFSGVSPCGEQQAAAGTCTEASRIGNVQLTAGAGPDPYRFAGQAYLTGPYSGAPQGLSLVVPVNAGPFDLGTVIVRASVQLDPTTRQMTIESDPLPTVLDGIPLRLTEFALQIDQGEFRLNPEGCEPLTVAGTLTDTQGDSVPIFASAFSPGSQETFTGCPPPSAVPILAPAGVSPGAARALLASTRITTTGRGKATVKLTCIGTERCRGRLTLAAKAGERKKGERKKGSKAKTIATSAFSISPGKTTAIELELNGTGRALLGADHGRLDANLTVQKSSPVPVQTRTENVQLVEQRVNAKTK